MSRVSLKTLIAIPKARGKNGCKKATEQSNDIYGRPRTCKLSGINMSIGASQLDQEVALNSKH